MSRSSLMELRWAYQRVAALAAWAMAPPSLVTPVPASVDGVLQAHRLRAIRQGQLFLLTPRSEEGLRHLLQSRREIRAAIAIIGEWSVEAGR
jgi:hypothetical protein